MLGFWKDRRGCGTERWWTWRTRTDGRAASRLSWARSGDRAAKTTRSHNATLAVCEMEQAVGLPGEAEVRDGAEVLLTLWAERRERRVSRQFVWKQTLAFVTRGIYLNMSECEL